MIVKNRLGYRQVVGFRCPMRRRNVTPPLVPLGYGLIPVDPFTEFIEVVWTDRSGQGWRYSGVALGNDLGNATFNRLSAPNPSGVPQPMGGFYYAQLYKCAAKVIKSKDTDPLAPCPDIGL